jgi:uncharacterized repeat protein (TIGR04138 family)
MSDQPHPTPEEQAPDPQEALRVLELLVEEDRRYSRDAYHFIFEGLEYTIQQLGERRHIDGQELLKGLRTFARKEFGRLGKMVLRHWGIHNSQDIGNIVFNLVDNDLLKKQPDDSLDDFETGFDVDTLFEFSEPIEWAGLDD